jgi:hypothetical protein
MNCVEFETLNGAANPVIDLLSKTKVTLFKIKDQDRGDRPRYAYLLTKLILTKKVLVRKLPVIGMRDWLLIYEDTLVELSKRRL